MRNLLDLLLIGVWLKIWRKRDRINEIDYHNEYERGNYKHFDLTFQEFVSASMYENE